MDTLQLQVPPIPQLLTAGHGVWQVGGQHTERLFPVYDLIVVRSGMLYMTEERQEYAVGVGEFLLLEPNRRHFGHLACEEPTEVYWVHWRHEEPVERLDRSSIAWSEIVKESTNNDIMPPIQYLYLPKYGEIGDSGIIQTLDELVELKERRTMETTMELQGKFVYLLSELQSFVRGTLYESRTAAVAKQVMRYLEDHLYEDYHADKLSRELHINRDYAARCMKRHTGLSPLNYLMHRRIEAVKKRLRTSDIPINEIAAQAGYADYNYFIRIFSKHVGMPPGQYRRKASDSL